MHELLLFASVPAHQHHELLQQLAGLTAMQPQHRLERRLVFKAYRKPGLVNVRIGASQDLQGAELQRLNKMLNGGMFYTQVVGPVSEADFGAPASPGADQDAHMSGTDEKSSVRTHYYDYESQPWKLEFRDIPEAATRSAVTARLMASASLPKGDITVPMNAWGYKSVIISLFQILETID
jgi:mediator of RNA polymerase II transcription subunit 18